MDIQEIIVLTLVILAVAYLGRLIFRNLRSKKGCASGCNKCGVDFTNIKP